MLSFAEDTRTENPHLHEGAVETCDYNQSACEPEMKNSSGEPLQRLDTTGDAGAPAVEATAVPEGLEKKNNLVADHETSEPIALSQRDTHSSAAAEESSVVSKDPAPAITSSSPPTQSKDTISGQNTNDSSSLSDDTDGSSLKRRAKPQPKSQRVDDAQSEDSLEPPKKKRGRPCSNPDKDVNSTKNNTQDKPQLTRQSSHVSIDKANAHKHKSKVSVAGANKTRGRKPSVSSTASYDSRRGKDRALLPSVFSCERDAVRAFTAIRYMVNITQGGMSAMHRFLKSEEAPLQKHIAKIPMPLTSEISVCLDILESKSAFVWRQLAELRREETVIQSINTEPPAQRREREVVEEIMRSIVDTVVERSSCDIGDKPHLINTVEPIVSQCLRHNRARIDESNIALSLIDREAVRQNDRNFTMQLINENAAQLRKNRPVMISEIRRRKLDRRKAWDILGNRYLSIKHKYVGSMGVEEEQEDTDSRLRGGRSLVSARFSARLGSSSQRGDGIRGDIDSDRLLHQLYLRETLEMRTTKGKADIPDMLCPWTDPDTSRPIIPLNATENGSEALPKFPGRQPLVIDLSGSRMTTDGKRQVCSLLSLNDPCPRGCNCARQVEVEGRKERPWTDIEKCIFLDKFVQYPKNFPKISSFLTNRDTKECIKFYYDSKARVQYKSLLREFDNRRRNQRNAWSFTTAVAESVGAGVYLSDEAQEREPVIELPVDDLRYHFLSSHANTSSFISNYQLPILSAASPIYAKNI